MSSPAIIWIDLHQGIFGALQQDQHCVSTSSFPTLVMAFG